MRIIAGKFRSRLIKVPQTGNVRPTTDRNREAIFNYLSNIIDFEGIRVLDLYAGSGALGLEALSRGAGYIDFVEKSYKVAAVLKSNIAALDSTENCNVILSEAVKYSRVEPIKKYDLILADPPFFKDDIHIVVKNLLHNNFLDASGIMIVERSIQTKETDATHFQKDYFKKLGDSLIYRFP